MDDDLELESTTEKNANLAIEYCQKESIELEKKCIVENVGKLSVVE